VVEQAGFCHKCGERLDLADRPFPSNTRREGAPVSEFMSAGPQADQPATEPAPSPREKFMEAAAARQEVEEEPERELWQGSYSPKAMVGAWMLSALITVGLLVLAIWAKATWFWWVVVIVVLLLLLYQFLKLCYRRMNVRYLLTTQRFIHETGILRRVTDRIEVIDMDDITFEQTVLERVVGVGTIRITSSDRTHPELLLRGIEDVKEVSGKIDDIRRSERRRRGLHIESI